MDWIQFLILFVSMIGIFLSNRSEAKESAKEMKDFHGRLCTLEERYLQMLQKMLEQKNGG